MGSIQSRRKATLKCSRSRRARSLLLAKSTRNRPSASVLHAMLREARGDAACEPPTLHEKIAEHSANHSRNGRGVVLRDGLANGAST